MTRKKKKPKSDAPAGTTPPRATPRPGSVLPGGWRPRYSVLIGVVVLVAGLCVLYPQLIFQNKVFLAGDVEAAASFATPVQKAMDAGESYPLWNPYLFSGMPSYGSLSYTPYVYPMSIVTSFLTAVLRFPNMTWLLFHIFLLGLGVFLLLREHGVHFVIALGAGVLMMWMPNHVAVGVYGHGSQASAVAYIPFALLFWDRLWRGKGVLTNASALVIVLGFQLLRAHIQISFYTFALLGLYLLFFGALRIRDAVRGGSSDGRAAPIFAFAARTSERGTPLRGALFETGTLGAVFIVVVIGAFLVSAVLLLPVHDYAKYSIRGASESGGLDYDYATSWSLHPAEMMTFVLPFAYGFGKALYHGHMPFTDYPNYVGLFVALFAIYAMVAVRTRFARFLMFIAIVTTLVAFGKHLPILYSPLFRFLPYFNKFRVPVMVLIVQQLALVLLFGLGLSAMLAVDPEKGKKRSLWGIAAAALLLLLSLATYDYWKNAFPREIAGGIRNVRSTAEQIQLARIAGTFVFSDLVRTSLFLLALFSLLMIYFRRLLGATVITAIVLVLAAADLYLVDGYIIHPNRLLSSESPVIQDKSVRDRFLEADDVVRFLQKDKEPYRIFPIYHPQAALMGDFRSNRYMNFGIASIGGYHPAKLAIYEDFLKVLGKALQNGNLQLVDMLNVRYLVAANPLPENPVFNEVWKGKNYRDEPAYVYENSLALPRVFFVDHYRVIQGKKALDVLAARDGPDLSHVAILEGDPPIAPVSAAGATAEITHYGFNKIEIHAKLESPAILVLSEIFYPAWRAYVDGTEARIMQTNYLLRSVALAAGEHDITFEYDTSLLRRSLALSAVTLAVVLLVLIVSLFRSNRGGVAWKHSS